MEKLFENNQEFDNEAVGKVTGEVPEWLDGVLIRTGPGYFY